MREKPLIPALLVLLASGACSPGSGFAAASTESPAGNEVYIPADVADGIAELKRLLPPDEISEIKSVAESDLAHHHMGLGMWIRNNWGLWGESRLKTHFNDLGIHHPDDMSAILLHSLWRDLNGRPIDLDDQLACYRDWWREQERLKQQYGDKTSFPMPNFSCPDREEHYERLTDKPAPTG